MAPGSSPRLECWRCRTRSAIFDRQGWARRRIYGQYRAFTPITG